MGWNAVVEDLFVRSLLCAPFRSFARSLPLSKNGLLPSSKSASSANAPMLDTCGHLRGRSGPDTSDLRFVPGRSAALCAGLHEVEDLGHACPAASNNLRSAEPKNGDSLPDDLPLARLVPSELGRRFLVKFVAVQFNTQLKRAVFSANQKIHFVDPITDRNFVLRL